MLNRVYISLILILSVSLCANGQINLVPNPSFEAYTTCPNSQGQVERAYPWFNPTSDTPDYANGCSGISSVGVPVNNWGYQYARTGQAYMGIFVCDDNNISRREYIEVELNDTLQNGQKYYCSFYIALSIGNADGACNNFGVCLTNDSLINYATIQVLNGTPVYSHPTIIYDTLNWTKIEFVYTANGGERFLTIGNFYPDSLTQQYNFYDPSDTITFTTSYYYIDDIYLGEYTDTTDTNEINPHLEFSVYPNPNNGIMQVNYSFEEQNELIFYDAIGKTVKVYTLSPDAHTMQINLYDLSNGVYSYLVRDKNKMSIHNGKIIKLY